MGRDERSKQRGHRSAILWFTGLSGSGKSTLANAVNAALFERGLATYVLDGDNIRHGLCKDLGFSDADREENTELKIDTGKQELGQSVELVIKALQENSVI